MRYLPLENLLDLLDRAVIGRNCVQAWIGYAAVLFLGFGEEVLPPPIINERGHQEHLMPPYELVTGYSSWKLTQPYGSVLDSDDLTNRTLRTEGETTLGTAVVGVSALRWEVLMPSWELRLYFESGCRLDVIRYSDAAEDPERDLWAFRSPDGFYTGVLPNHRIYTRHGSERPSKSG